MVKQRKSTSPASVIPEEEVFTLESLLDYKKESGRDFYLVKWKGYSEDEATWEPRVNILSPGPELLKQMSSLRGAHLVKKRKSPTGGDNDDDDISHQPVKKRETRNSEASASSSSGSASASASSSRKSVQQDMVPRSPFISKVTVHEGQFRVTLNKGPGSDDTEMLTMELARDKYPQELLDFLLERVRFLPLSERGKEWADGPTPSGKVGSSDAKPRSSTRSASMSESTTY